MEHISQLRSVTRHMGSHSVTCHPTQVVMLTRPMDNLTLINSLYYVKLLMSRFLTKPCMSWIKSLKFMI